MNTKLWGKKDEEQWQRKLWHQYHTELKPLVRRGSHAQCHCQAYPWVLHEPVKPFIHSNLVSNYTVRWPLNAQSLLCKVVCWQLCVLKATEQWERSFLFIIISPAMIKKRGLSDVICPLHSYPGRRPGNAPLGGNESCCDYIKREDNHTTYGCRALRQHHCRLWKSLDHRCRIWLLPRQSSCGVGTWHRWHLWRGLCNIQFCRLQERRKTNQYKLLLI